MLYSDVTKFPQRFSLGTLKYDRKESLRYILKYPGSLVRSHL